MSARIEMLNRALMRIGAEPVIDDLDPLAAPHLAIYTGVIERLAAAPFTFFKHTRRLLRLAAAPVPAHYKYGYQLPPDRAGPPRAIYADADKRLPVTDYDIERGILFCDHEAVWVTGLFTAGPETWPGDFRELFTVALMAELALSVREDRPLHDRLYQKCFGSPGQNGVGGMYAEVLYNDNQAVPSTVLGAGVSPLLDVR